MSRERKELKVKDVQYMYLYGYKICEHTLYIYFCITLYTVSTYCVWLNIYECVMLILLKSPGSAGNASWSS